VNLQNARCNNKDTVTYIYTIGRREWEQSWILCIHYRWLPRRIVLVVTVAVLQARQLCASNAVRCALLFYDSNGPIILFGVFLNEDAERLFPAPLHPPPGGPKNEN
jgi:hypothetical protein